MILEPLSGDVDAVRVLADSLTVGAARLVEVASALQALRADAVWDDDAGRAFGAGVAACPPVIDRVIDRYAGAAGALRSLAPVLEESQRVVTAAVRDEQESMRRYVAIEDQVVALVAMGKDEADPEVAGLRRLQREQVVIQQRARAQHAAAWARFGEADRRCAGVLRSLADNAIRDSLPYRGIRGATVVSRDVAALAAWAGPEAAPVAAAAGVVSAAGETTLLIGYREGSWSAVLGEAGWAALGFGGGALRLGATVGARKVDGRFVAGGPASVRKRLARGSAAEVATRRKAFVKGFEGVPVRGTPTALAGTVPQQRIRERLTDLVDAKVRDGWRKASANGPLGRRMYISGVTLGTASKAGPRVVDKVGERVGDRGRSEDQQRSTCGSALRESDLSLGPCVPASSSMPRS